MRSDQPTAVPILMYHQVSEHVAPGFAKYTVTPHAFAAQLRWLQWAGYEAIDLDQFAAAREHTATLPPRPVIITFDDGFQDCLLHAPPALAARGFSATFFLVAGLVGEQSHWLAAERGIRLSLADWPAARRLVDAGFTVGAHTLTHPRLTSLQASRAREEIVESKRHLEERLATEVRHMAYPFGDFNAGVRDVVANSGFRTACSVRRGIATVTDDLYSLRRVPIDGRESIVGFIARLHTAHGVGEMLRGSVAFPTPAPEAERQQQ